MEHPKPLLVTEIVFISKFWRELFKALGTTLSFSSSYHPQTDSQTEVLNRCLETYLRCFAGEEPHQWTRFLPLAEYWYNSSFHSAIGMSPFEALYGRPPPSISCYNPSHSKIASLDEILSKKGEVLQLLKANLARARNRMTQQANRKRTDKTFSEGDWVYLKLQPYRQLSLKQRASQKLSKRYYGPFRILRKIGFVAYELDLPSSARMHPVFHISLLKLCHGQPSLQISAPARSHNTSTHRSTAISYFGPPPSSSRARGRGRATCAMGRVRCI